MIPRFRVPVAAALIAALALASPALALEKRAERLVDDEHGDLWRGSTTCSIAYYNTCTGWVWIWSTWGPNDRLGVSFDTCCPGATTTGVVSSWLYVWTGSPSGYGFTGTVDIFDADANGCPTGAALASQPFLPTSSWQFYDFGTGGVTVPDNTFALAATLGPGANNPLALVTDHPDVGPTGPAACGTCFPTTRVNHSFYWGTPASVVCPGSSLNDGLCDAQFLWDAQVTCTTPVEPSTWGQLKNLYR